MSLAEIVSHHGTVTPLCEAIMNAIMDHEVEGGGTFTRQIRPFRFEIQNAAYLPRSAHEETSEDEASSACYDGYKH